MTAIIPGLCPFDDILLWSMIPVVAWWLRRKFKWCRKSCDCKCHDKTSKESTGTEK